MKIAEIKISYSSTQDKRVKVKESYNAFKALLDIWNIETIELHEEVKVILLNRASEILGFYNLAKGGVSGCYVDIKLILSIALKANASSIILSHNHPSGNLIPSKSDKSITAKLKKACELVDLSLLDHLIISKKDYFSFADNVLL